MSEPADTLRRAAEKVRGLAEAATPGPWDFDGNPSNTVVATAESRRSVGAFTGAHLVGGTYNYDPEQNAANAAWIAAVHPGVGKALADLLDERADVACPARWWGEGCGDTGDCLVHRHALAVARLLLGNQQ